MNVSAGGRIRTCGALRREFYRLGQLSTLSPQPKSNFTKIRFLLLQSHCTSLKSIYTHSYMVATEQSSLLQPAGGRHETVTSRTATIRKLAEDCHIPVPDEFSADQHFWFRVQEGFSSERTLLLREAPEIPPNRQRFIAIKSSVRHAIQVCEEEKNRATDALTGLWSRPALNNYLARLLGKLNRDSSSQPGIWGIGIAMLDIDNFKRINDEY